MSKIIGSQNFSNAIAHLDDGNIERTTAQVVNHDLLVGFLINAVSQRSCCRLVDDTLYVQTSNGTGVLGCLTLAVVEVSGNGDDAQQGPTGNAGSAPKDDGAVDADFHEV